MPTNLMTSTTPMKTRQCELCSRELCGAWRCLQLRSSVVTFCIFRYDAPPEGPVWMTPYYLEGLRGEGIVQIATGYVLRAPVHIGQADKACAQIQPHRSCI